MTYLLCRLDCQPDNVTENDNPPLPHGVPSARTVLFPQTIGKPPIKGEKHKKHTNPYPAIKAGKHPITIYRS